MIRGGKYQRNHRYYSHAPLLVLDQVTCVADNFSPYCEWLMVQEEQPTIGLNGECKLAQEDSKSECKAHMRAPTQQKQFCWYQP